MAVWRYKIELNEVLRKMDDEHDLSRAEEPCSPDEREALAVEVAKAWPLARFAKKLRDAKSIAEVNRVLELVYDEADRSRVWCGL